MYRVYVESSFSAMHQVPLADGSLEPLHGHDWHVRVEFASPTLNDAGMVVDFVRARAALEGVLAEVQHGNLNALPAFAGSPPTAERVARWVFDRLAERNAGPIRRVCVTEAPGWRASYERIKNHTPLEKTTPDPVFCRLRVGWRGSGLVVHCRVLMRPAPSGSGGAMDIDGR